MDVKKIRHRPAATVGTVRESHQVDRRNWLAVVKVVQEFAPKSAEAEKIGDFWYALYVRPRFEKLVHYQLAEKGYETFFPTYISRRKWSDRVKSLCLPLFPGYVFCRFDIRLVD